MEKDGQRGLLIASHKRLGKKTLMGHNSWGGGRPCPCTLGAARVPASQAAAAPHLALTGADPSPPGQPQEQIPEGNPHAEVEIKPQLRPRGSVVKEEDQKPSHKLYKLQTKSTGSTSQILCL